jgi:hypothetical protein
MRLFIAVVRRLVPALDLGYSIELRRANTKLISAVGVES